MKATNDGNDGKQQQGENGDPRRMWPALINLVNSHADYWRTQTQKANDPQPEKIRFWTMITAIGTCAAAVLAGAAAIVFWKQFGAMVDANKASDAALKLDQRAWVAPITTEIRSEPAKDGVGMNFVVPFANTGKTPALDVHAWINRTFDLNQIVSDSNDTLASRMLISPGNVGNTSTANFPVTPTEVEQIKKAVRIYIYGTIWYRDIFRKDHWTQFCFYPGPDLKAFGPCDRHNQTDDTEKQQPQNAN